MIPSVVASSASPATPVLNSVIQNQAQAQLESTWGLSYSPVSGGGTIQVQSSPDNTTWTDATITSGGTAPLTTGTRTTLVNGLAEDTYYRINQVLFGATSNWSNSVQFTANLATAPIAPPTSVTITGVTRPFVDRYRVFITVVQPGAITGFSGVGLKTVTDYSVFENTEVISGNIASGSTAYEIDILSGAIPGASFQVTVYNQAGGYESTGVASNIWTIQDEIVEFFLSQNPITVPGWATNFDYWLVGGGGGGGSGLVVSNSNNEAISNYYAGDPGLAGSVQTGNLALPIADLNFLMGTGGTGADRLFNENAEAGASSQLRSNTTPLVTAAGGAAGANDVVVSFPAQPAAGNPSANLTVDSTTFNGMLGAAPAEGGSYPNADTSLMDSPRVTGGAGGGYAWPDAGLPNGEQTVFAGGIGGPGYCKIRFRNY